MKIGFTGTRKGLTQNQTRKLKKLLKTKLKLFREFHHGDCFGADVEAHKIIESLRDSNKQKIIVHPPVNASNRAFSHLLTPHNCIMNLPKPYLERNHVIVNECDILIACPDSKQEKTRSGTWATIRYARKMNKRIIYIFP